MIDGIYCTNILTPKDVHLQIVNIIVVKFFMKIKICTFHLTPTQNNQSDIFMVINYKIFHHPLKLFQVHQRNNIGDVRKMSD